MSAVCKWTMNEWRDAKGHRFCLALTSMRWAPEASLREQRRSRVARTGFFRGCCFPLVASTILYYAAITTSMKTNISKYLCRPLAYYVRHWLKETSIKCRFGGPPLDSSSKEQQFQIMTTYTVQHDWVLAHAHTTQVFAHLVLAPNWYLADYCSRRLCK